MRFALHKCCLITFHVPGNETHLGNAPTEMMYIVPHEKLLLPEDQKISGKPGLWSKNIQKMVQNRGEIF